VLGLVAALRVNGHKVDCADVGEGGLGGLMLSDLKDEMAVVWW
jgi:hypothetical protein